MSYKVALLTDLTLYICANPILLAWKAKIYTTGVQKWLYSCLFYHVKDHSRTQWYKTEVSWLANDWINKNINIAWMWHDIQEGEILLSNCAILTWTQATLLDHWQDQGKSIGINFLVHIEIVTCSNKGHSRSWPKSWLQATLMDQWQEQGKSITINLWVRIETVTCTKKDAARPKGYLNPWDIKITEQRINTKSFIFSQENQVETAAAHSLIFYR